MSTHRPQVRLHIGSDTLEGALRHTIEGVDDEIVALLVGSLATPQELDGVEESAWLDIDDEALLAKLRSAQPPSTPADPSEAHPMDRPAEVLAAAEAAAAELEQVEEACRVARSEAARLDAEIDSHLVRVRGLVSAALDGLQDDPSERPPG